MKRLWCYLFHQKLWNQIRLRWWSAHLVGCLFRCPKCNEEFYHSQLKHDYGTRLLPGVSEDSSLTWEECNL